VTVAGANAQQKGFRTESMPTMMHEAPCLRSRGGGLWQPGRQHFRKRCRGAANQVTELRASMEEFASCGVNVKVRIGFCKVLRQPCSAPPRLTQAGMSR
jgi:hypothetical protein